MSAPPWKQLVAAHYGLTNRNAGIQKPSEIQNDLRNKRNLEFAKDHGLLFSPDGRLAVDLIEFSHPDGWAMLNQIVEEAQMRVAMTSPFVERPTEFNKGDLVLGRGLFNQEPQRMYSQGLGNHTLLTARPGGGKTSLIKTIAAEIGLLTHAGVISPPLNFLLLDSEKEDLASDLKPIFDRLGIPLFVSQDFPFNALQFSPVIAARDFLAHITQTIADALDLLEPGKRLLQQHVFQLYTSFGVFEASKYCKEPDQYPTLVDLFESVANDRKANVLTKEGLINRLGDVLYLNPNLRIRKGPTSEHLANRNTILEIGNRSEGCRYLTGCWILENEYLRRKALGWSNVPFNWLIVIDDGQRICRPGGWCERWLPIVRSQGIGLLVSIQHTLELGANIPTNCGTKITGVLGSGWDLCPKTMGLTGEQARWLQLHLQPLQFVCALESGWRLPFLIQVSRPNLNRETTPNDMRGING